MEEIIKARLVELSSEVEALANERSRLFERDKEISVRMDQLIGAIYELQKLLNTQPPQSES